MLTSIDQEPSVVCATDVPTEVPLEILGDKVGSLCFKKFIY